MSQAHLVERRRREDEDEKGTMASSSHGGSVSSAETVGRITRYCHCNVPSPLVTSWSKENPGRRFWGCGKYQATKVRCKFFRWYDEDGNPREKKLIAALLRRCDAYKNSEKKLRLSLGISVLVNLVLVIIIAVLIK